MRFAIRTLGADNREVMRFVDVPDNSVPSNIVTGRASSAPVTVRLHGHDVPIEEIDRAYHAAHGQQPAATGTVRLTDGRGNTYEVPAADAARYQRRGSTHHAAFTDDDDAASDDTLPTEAVGAIVKFNDEVNRTAKEQGVDIRRAAEIVQLRDGGTLFWLSRCEAAGHRVPRVSNRRNRHFIRDDE